MKPQKRNTGETAKKRCKKEQPIQKEKPVEKPSVIQKPPVIEKTKNQRKKEKYEVFGKCVTATAATTNKNEKRI